MEKITKSFLALVLMFVGMVSALAQPVAPVAPEAPAAPKATALVTDGSVKQYLYNVGAKGFFIGANDWGTRASFSAEKGYWVQITKNATGDTYTLKNEAKGGNSADCQAVDQIWVDGAGRAGDALWTVTANEDGSFKLGNTNVAGFLSVVPSKNDTKLYMSEAAEAQNVWIVVSEEDYAAYQEAVPAYQAALKEYNDAYAQYQIEYAEWFKANYKAGDQLTVLAPADWVGQGGSYTGLANPAKEKYVDGGNAPLKAGDVMTQTIDGLKNGTYVVKLEAAGSYTSGRGFECPTGDGLAVAFANDQEENLPIVDRGWVGEGEQNFYTFNAEVTDGTLKYGIKNLADAGNWYVVRLASITMVPEPDAWYTDNLFCYKDAANNVSRSMELPWVADPDDAANGCITLSSAANAANDHDLQFMIRGAEYDGADLMNGAFAEGIGFKVSFKVKADGNYSGCLVGSFNSITATGKDGWKFGSYLGNQSVKLDVTTEWQTVSYTVIAGSGDAGKLTAIGFNLADKGGAARTFYFDDVKITRGGSEWYVNNEFHAKDYQDPAATYADDQNNPHPVARYVADGDYVEVISNAGADQTYNSQIWIAIPEKYVGKTTKMTFEVQASKAITLPESFQATATGCGWGCNASPGSGLVLPAGEWTTVERVLNTKDVKSNTWNSAWNGWQADQYCLDLSEKGGEAITYKFRNVKFDKAQQDWYTSGKIIAKDYVNGDETYTNSDDVEFPLARYVYADDGDYVEVQSNANRVDEWDSQIWIEIPEAWVGKKVKMTMDVQASKEVTAAAAYHSFAGGNHWGPGAGEGVPFKVGEWTSIERVLNTKEVTCNKGQQVKYYVLNLSNDEKGEGTGITYKFKNIAWSEAPVDKWADLIPLQDFEAGYTGADDEKLYFFEKEQPISSDTYRARIVDGVGVDGGKAIEFRYSENAEQGWYSQFEIRLPYLLPNGTKIRVKADIKATVSQDGMGGQVWYNDFGSYRGGIPGYALTADTWYTYDKEITISDSNADDDPQGLRFIVFDGKGGAPANTLYFDNISVQIPEDQVPAGEPSFLNATDYPIFNYVDPSTLDWTDNLFTNGDIEGEDMSAFIAKVNSDADALLLPAGSKTFKGSNQILVKSAAREKDPADETKYLGNDHDTQFFVRLPYALAKGTKYYFSVDVISNKVVDVQSQTHAEPGQWKSNTGVGKISVSSDALTVADYFTADNDMRTIAFNLASATDGGMFYFDNFVFKVVKDEEAAIQEFTAKWDETSTWNETFALNQAVDAGRNTETEGQGYTEESVKALTDAIAAGKAELANAEATKETLAAAAKAITDAIAGLSKGEELLPKPDLTDLIEIAQDQGKTLDDFARTELVEGEDFNTYTATADLQVAFKMYDIDVAGCDYVTVKFATPAPAGWCIAFWAQGGTDNVEIPEGATEYKYVFADDAKCAIKDDVLPQICVLTLWGAAKPLNMKVYGVYKHKVPAELAYTDLTPEMFFQWTDWTDAEPTASAYCEYKIDEASGQPYGDPSVNNYADLSEYATLEVTATAGSPRFLFNRDVAEGQWSETEADSHLIDNTKGGWSAKYFTSTDNGDGTTTYVVDIAAIVADKGFAHLMAIKGANWADVTVSEMKLGYVGEKPVIPVPTNIFAVEDGASVKDGKYFINGQIVIVKDGVKYNAAGVAIK